MIQAQTSGMTYTEKLDKNEEVKMVRLVLFCLGFVLVLGCFFGFVWFGSLFVCLFY